MKRSKRMQMVLQLEERKTRQAEQALGRARQALAVERQKLDQLKGFRQEYQDNLMRQGRQGIHAEQLVRTQQFLARLDDAMAQQEQQIRRVEQQVDALRQQWQEARGKEQAMTSLVERLQREERVLEEKQLQKAIDELAQRRGRFR